MARTSLVGLLFAVAGPLGAWSAAAEIAELPLEAHLDADSVSLELWSADVDVTVDPDAEAVLRAATVDAGAGPVALEVSADGRLLAVRRGADDLAPRIRVEVTVTPGQELALAGRDLAVTIADARSAEELLSGEEELGDAESEADGGPDDEAAGSPAAGAPAAAPVVLRVTVDDSRVDFSGIRNAAVKGARNAVWMTRTSGSFALTLEGGSAAVHGHQGDLALTAAASEVTVHDLVGKLEPRLTGGSLDVRQGVGIFAGTVVDSVLLFDGWLGYVTLSGEGATVEARGVDQPRRWNLDGTDLLVNLERIAGPVIANLDGGSFKASSMGGRVSVTAGGRAEVTLSDLAQGADVKVSEGSTARLDAVAGQIRVELNDAELRAERCGRMILSGARSRVELAAIDRLAQLEMTDSDVVLDLTASGPRSSLKLLGAGRASVSLTAPCVVRVDGPSRPGGSTIEVSGCELRLSGQPDRPSRRHLIYGDREPTTLAVWLDEGVELEVEGLP